MRTAGLRNGVPQEAKRSEHDGARPPALQKMQRNRHDHGGRRHEKTAS